MALRRTPISTPGEHALWVARWIEAHHGIDALATVCARLARGDNGQAIATDLGVTRNTVSSWRKALGVPLRIYIVHADIQALADAKGPLPTFPALTPEVP